MNTFIYFDTHIKSNFRTFTVLAEDAIKAALSDYRIKQQSAQKENSENQQNDQKE